VGSNPATPTNFLNPFDGLKSCIRQAAEDVNRADTLEGLVAAEFSHDGDLRVFN
jgi:hypothetical protein